MKNEKIVIKIMWAFSLLPVLVTLVLFNKLPGQIPMHWNIKGEIDSWYPKFPGAFFIPALCIVITFMTSVLPQLDPKKENYEKFKLQYFIIRLFLVIFFAILQAVVISISLGANFIRVDTVVKLLIGVMFIIFGNLMPKLKHNYFVGIKTPWTIANETVWTKSHRHGGFVWFIAGFVMSALAFIPGTASAIAYFTLIMISAFEPIIYSWVRYKNVAK